MVNHVKVIIFIILNSSVEGKQHVECRDRKQGTVLDDGGSMWIYNRQVYIASSCYIDSMVW